MITAIIGKLGIDVEKLLSKQDKLAAEPVLLKAHLREDIASTSKKDTFAFSEYITTNTNIKDTKK
jgi:hypothetical protein